MTIQTLLVHLAPDPHCNGRIDAAVTMAKTMNAHLIALYVATPVHMPAGAEGRGASAAYLHEATENARNAAAGIREALDKAAGEAGISYEWSYGEADHLEELLEEVHHVDLTVLNQVSFDRFEDRLMFQLPEKLVMGAGGPVLVLPKGGDGIDFTTINRVLIAWTYSKEAIRAVRDSLEILHQANRVDVIACGDPRKQDEDAPAKAIIDYLARHGVKAEPYTHPTKGHAGEEILEVADYLESDLIVMGAYGHTSLLDKLFGSASRYVIGHSEIPVFMSH